ncbi:hypothetical protein [Anaerococcus cruorum]|uniref:Uncharacterized protein n=1 Tax=Anaerococcus cruorum TaxID=3115617 RepID=A0ABW9MWA7_9FIRM
MDNVKDITDVLSTQGTDRTIVAIFLILFIIAFIAKWKQDNEDTRARREEMQHYRLWQKERVEKLDGLNDKMIEVIYENSCRLNKHEEILNHHSQQSADNFKEIDSQLKVINAKVDDLYKQSQELATKAGLDEVKQELIKLANKY